MSILNEGGNLVHYPDLNHPKQDSADATKLQEVSAAGEANQTESDPFSGLEVELQESLTEPRGYKIQIALLDHMASIDGMKIGPQKRDVGVLKIAQSVTDALIDPGIAQILEGKYDYNNVVKIDETISFICAALNSSNEAHKKLSDELTTKLTEIKAVVRNTFYLENDPIVLFDLQDFLNLKRDVSGDNQKRIKDLLDNAPQVLFEQVVKSNPDNYQELYDKLGKYDNVVMYDSSATERWKLKFLNALHEVYFAENNQIQDEKKAKVRDFLIKTYKFLLARTGYGYPESTRRLESLQDSEYA